MTNAMPSLQMTIKLSYGWRALRPPAVLSSLSPTIGAVHERPVLAAAQPKSLASPFGGGAERSEAEGVPLSS